MDLRPQLELSVEVAGSSTAGAAEGTGNPSQMLLPSSCFELSPMHKPTKRLNVRLDVSPYQRNSLAQQRLDVSPYQRNSLAQQVPPKKKVNHTTEDMVSIQLELLKEVQALRTTQDELLEVEREKLAVKRERLEVEKEMLAIAKANLSLKQTDLILNPLMP